VLAGTVNGTGVLRVRVLRDAADSVVAGIAAQVERAAETKSTRQLLVERVEQRYSVVVVAATVLLLAVPLLRGADFTGTLLRATTFMIVASPCAIAVAGRRGTLVKDATVLEALAEVDAVVLDKTGTLTTGHPQVVAATPIGGRDADAVLALAAAAEAGSEHVLAAGPYAATLDRGLDLPAADGFTAIPGEGCGRSWPVPRWRSAARSCSPSSGARSATNPRSSPATPNARRGSWLNGSAVGDGAGGLALQAADGVLTRDPIGALAPLVDLARRARRISRANPALAAAVIIVLVTWDLVGSLPLALGVAGHELSTVVVCLNGTPAVRRRAGPRGALRGTQRVRRAEGRPRMIDFTCGRGPRAR
jgi:cation transport ATPase